MEVKLIIGKQQLKIDSYCLIGLCFSIIQDQAMNILNDLDWNTFKIIKLYVSSCD